MLASRPPRAHCLPAGLNLHKAAALSTPERRGGDEERDVERRERLGKERGMWRRERCREEREMWRKKMNV